MFCFARGRCVGNYRVQRDQDARELICAGGSGGHGPKPADAVAQRLHTDGAKPQAAVAQKENAPRNDPKSSHSPEIIFERRTREGALLRKATARKPVSSGKTYIVKKGDNPVTIAKKLKVPYDDLIALNHIDDPRKLQIGQKLLIPTAKTKEQQEAENRIRTRSSRNVILSEAKNPHSETSS